MISFRELDLIEPIQQNIAAAGYTIPTPIQAEAIPALLAGQDLLGCAQTGTGKTAAFSLPLLQRLLAGNKKVSRRACRALILVPTRELAVQVADSLNTYGKGLGLTHTLIYGGVGYPLQISAVGRGVDIVVATPGRLLDLIDKGYLRLWEVETLILDEADRMLDMGFIHDIRQILACIPRNRQTMLFSATLAGIAAKLAEEILTDPVTVSVSPASTPIEKVEQQLLFVDSSDKRALLDTMLRDEACERALVFTRSKHGAGRLARQLSQVGLRAEAIHGDKTQFARQQALNSFRDGKCRVLVATDVAARGLDVDGITHVFNFDLPMEPETYVHRIGRTGRAGADGIAVSFCSREDRGKLREIEQLIKRDIPVVHDHEFHCAETADMMTRGNGRGPGGNGGGNRGGGGGGGGRPGRRRNRSGSPRPAAN